MQIGWKINKVGLGIISPKFTFEKLETTFYFIFGTSSSCVETLCFWNKYLARGGTSISETWSTRIS